MIDTSSKPGSIVFITLLLIFIIFPLNANMSEALDNPHNINNTVNCADCHVSSPPAGWWTDQGSTNGICSSCHNDSTAVYVKTHSSANTSAKYGTWYKKCTDCHNPHYQRQNRIYKSASYLYTGTSTAVTANALTKAGAGWTEDRWKGKVLLPNVGYTSINYRIASNTSDTITIDTGGGDSINLTYIKPGATFAIVYGKLLKESVSGKTVKFFRNSGANSFSDGVDGTGMDGICEVCHTQTKNSSTLAVRYRNTGHADSHFESQKCTDCHEHIEGFKASCASCHGSIPVDAGTLVFSPAPTGSATAGAHNVHVTNKGIGCEDCHANSVGSGTTHNDGLTITMGFTFFSGLYKGGSYDGQTTANYNATVTVPPTVVSKSGLKKCSNIYCHGSTMDQAGDKNGGTNITPVWDNPATGSCGTCHGATSANPPLRGSHRTHVLNGTWSYAPGTEPPFNNYIYGRNLACTVCHSNYVSNHVNGKADWSFDTAAYTRLSGAQYKGNSSGSSSPVPGTYGQCANLYCHSIIQTSTGGPLTGLPGEYKTPTWGNRTEGNCGTCHGVDAGHAYWAGLPDTTPEMSTGSHTKHLEILGLNAGLGATPGGPGRCTVCHNYVGSDNLLGCASVCHNRGDLHVNYQIEVRFPPTTYGSSAAYNGPPVPGDGFGGCSNTYCHGNYSGSGLNATPTWGNSATAACGSCHGASNTTAPNSGTHFKHVGSTYYEYTCTLCHKDIVSGTPSASYSIADKSKHVSGYIDWNFDSTDGRTSGGAYSIASGTVTPSDGNTADGRRGYGTCQVYCHSNVQPDGGIGAPTVYATPQWGTTISGCGPCHAGGHGNLIGTGSHTAHLSYSFTTAGNIYKCVICHNWYPSPGSLTCVNCHVFSGDKRFGKHANYQIDIAFDTAFNSSATYNGVFTPGNGYSSCNNTYCHSNGTSVSTGSIPPNTSPNWGTGTLACNSCHGNPPDYTNGTPKANSHEIHVAHFGCHYCHADTTSGGLTITSTANHVNKIYNVSPTTGLTWQTNVPQIEIPSSFTYTYSSTGGTCSNISCHVHPGAQNAVWGGEKMRCAKCHGEEFL